MLKQLRTKFIVLIMASVTVVLAVAFGTICYLNYQISVNTVKEQLMEYTEQALHFSEASFSAPLFPDSSFGSLPDGQGDSTGWGDKGPHIGGNPAREVYDYPIAVYLLSNSSSTTSLTYDANSTGSCTLYAISALSNASIEDDLLDKLSSIIASSEDGFGKLVDEGLYYARLSKDNVIAVSFVDASVTADWTSLALVLGLVGAGVLIVFFFISLGFSKWALRPVRETWDREQRFVADVSHDLKTPLTVILANNAILRQSPDATVGEMSQWVESTQTEAEEMQNMVHDMLELSKFDTSGIAKAKSGRDAADAVDIDLSHVVEAQVLMFESVTFEHNQLLDSDVAPGLTIHGEPTACSRLVSSLIENACKYAPAGSTITVRLAPDSEHRHAVYSVNNTGATISDEDLPHIFDRFYRADSARTANASSSDDRVATGHGLGLAIAYAIAESHGGKLSATSSDTEGVTFTATLPLVQRG